MAMTFDPIFAADPSNAANVAANAAITIFDPADVGMSPIAITDVTGSPLSNPITVNKNGFGPAFVADVDRVGWHGAGFTGYFTSYEGMKTIATDAADAAALAASEAGEAALANVADRIEAGEFNGAPGADGSNVLPTAEAIEQAIVNDGPAKTALNAAYASKRIHVILAAGQSNMSGRGADYSATKDPANSRILQFGSVTPTLRAATEPLDMHDTATGIGPAFQFARRYLRTLPGDDLIVIVPAAHGGTALSTNTTPLGWRWGVSGNLSAQAVTQTNAAIAAAQAAYPGATVTLDAILWIQGETDSSVTNMVSAETYMADLDALIAGFRSSFGNSELPFILGQMLPEAMGTGTRDDINAVHANTPYRIPFTGFSLSAPSGNSNGDLLHFNAAGQRINGKNMFEEFERVSVGLVPVNPDGDLPPVVIFADTFTRADGPVGTTEVGSKTWDIYGTGTPAANVSSNVLALSNGTSSARTVATVDAGVADGTLTFTLATAGDGSGQAAFRYVDLNNHLMVSRENGSSIVWAIWKRVAGTATLIAATATPIVSGDVVEVITNGTTVTVNVNAAQIWTGTITEHATATRYGVTAVNTWTPRWDDFEFETL